MTNKIALLLPKSVLYPQISFDIVGGLRNRLAELGVNDMEIKTENIGIAGDDKLIYAVCEKLLFDGVGIIAGYVNPQTAEKLEPLFAGANALFIVLDSGYHFRTSAAKLSHVFSISLQGALSYHIIARTAAEEGMKKFVYTSSFYDAGYRPGYAFYKGLEDAGGELLLNHITKLKRAEFTLEPIAEHLDTRETDAILAAFCGDMMQDFYTHGANSGILGRKPVYGGAFMGEEQWLAQIQYPGVEIKVCVPWGSNLENDANVHFKEVMKQKKLRANVFSLLGWEAAAVIAEALTAEDADEAAAKLEGYAYDSPRGTVTIDAQTHESNAPVYDARVVKDEAMGNCALAITGVSPFTEQQREKLGQDIASNSEVFSSWYNAYACLES